MRVALGVKLCVLEPAWLGLPLLLRVAAWLAVAAPLGLPVGRCEGVAEPAWLLEGVARALGVTLALSDALPDALPVPEADGAWEPLAEGLAAWLALRVELREALCE